MLKKNKFKKYGHKKKFLRHIIVDDQHRLLYCDVPKVASTNLKRLMLILSGKITAKQFSSIPRLTVHDNNPMLHLDAFDLTDILKIGRANYSKFIFVRHPYERLVSAYQDKLAGDNTFFQKVIGREIVEKYRKKPTQLSLNNGHDVTFPEFVSYVVDEWKQNQRQLDVHWRPASDLCLPCSMEYDFIGKFETMNQDVDFLLQRLNESYLSNLFKLSKTPTKTTLALWKKSIKEISHQQLSDLNDIFAEDFLLFGYPQYTDE
ncbi:hypothetical protein DAPPUDRAFT_326687 [Daphnia pulex]|uniref:Carbohydrate sulfotransferase n=1 Tax=Daphnia pulex TaxID=6669 RepID=E9H8H7_DAPPU|nr:hypothetical protein DAPPUDRAFT_326687 [Daphnia pulex]|eukprot:EFX71975.1 hypothetical protein DAPPUDRAFT_326687 [Daphnia pulex]